MKLPHRGLDIATLQTTSRQYSPCQSCSPVLHPLQLSSWIRLHGRTKQEAQQKLPCLSLEWNIPNPHPPRPESLDRAISKAVYCWGCIATVSLAQFVLSLIAYL
jgi:hypothetical protein